MGRDLLPLVVGFLLTSVLGGLLGYLFQRRTWEHQHDMQQRDQERQQALKTFEEVSRLLDRRLYRMRRLYWAARSRALGTSDRAELASALAGYREVLVEWNDNLNRTLALVHTYFGSQVREQLEDDIYEGFATLGRGLDEIVRMVSAAEDKRIEVPNFGYLVNRLSRRVYQLNVDMLELLEDDRIGRLAPPGSRAEAPSPTGEPRLQIGDQGRDVRRLQRALHRAGETVAVDGRFGQETWAAIRSIQRARGLDVDGIAGPDIWAALPSGGPMPLLRNGSRGEVVASLQRVLAEGAPARWKVAPEAVTGTFDASTSAAVRAFQQWHGVEADGQVGDHTWTAPVNEAGTTLEVAVGLEHLVVRDSQ
jgi:peptidoglycan hydrolase-like protein with peptidoglycan-binding domain